MSKLARSRKRAPIGGYCAPVRLEAWCRAGHTKACWVWGAVKRMAWRISPEATSSKRTSPGKIGRPAASVDVQPEGRNAFESRLKMAPDPAFQLAAWGDAA